MPYKISGTLSDAARVIIIKESDWSIESNTNESVGAYEIDGLESGAKLILGRKSDGESLGFGSVTAEEYTLPQRGIFAGGYASASRTDSIDYVVISAVSNATDFGNLSGIRQDAAACSNGINQRGLFLGGAGPSGNELKVIEYITISSTGNTSNFGELNAWIRMNTGADNGTNDRGISAGGFTGSVETDTIEYVTISSTGNASNFGDLTVTTMYFDACSNDTNDRGVFVGGDVSNIISYITISTTGNATDFGDLTSNRSYPSATSNGTNNRGVVGGGSNALNVIDYITITSLGTASDFGDLTEGRQQVAATSNKTNNRAVFGGGYPHPSKNTIDYVTITSLGDASDFGDLTEVRSGSFACSNA